MGIDVDCQVCRGGFYVVTIPAPEPPPMDDTAWASLPLVHRRRLVEQYGKRQNVPAYAPGRMNGKAVLCLCARGRAKLHAGVHCTPIERVLSETELGELWPDGLPAIRMSERLMAAGIPAACHGWTFDSFRRYFTEKKLRHYVQLATEWLRSSADKRTDLVIYGTHGTGKTGIAVSIARALIEKNEPAVYQQGYRFFASWRETFAAHGDGLASERAFIETKTDLQTLFLDEIDKVGDSGWIERSLLMLVDGRQKAERPTVLIVNLPETDEGGRPLTAMHHAGMLRELFGPALYDRLYERAQFWPMLGGSKRKMLGAEGKSEI